MFVIIAKRDTTLLLSLNCKKRPFTANDARIVLPSGGEEENKNRHYKECSKGRAKLKDSSSFELSNPFGIAPKRCILDARLREREREREREKGARKKTRKIRRDF